MIKRIIFWAHLVCGVATGLVIFWMSITGVILTYERQILAWDANKYQVEYTENQEKIPYQQLLSTAQTQLKAPITEMKVKRSEGAPVEFKAGRKEGVILNPYTGDVFNAASPALVSFFRTVTGLHRWFNLSGDSRETGKIIIGVSNLVFLFLILSGIYLWLPKVWRWGMLRIRILFIKMPTSRARDFNWHHVFSVWSFIPLIFIVATALVFSFSWANKAVFSVFGEELPPRSAFAFSYNQPVDNPEGVSPLAWSKLINNVEGYYPDWQTISMAIPKAGSSVFTVDQGNGGQPHLRDKIVLNNYTGDVLAKQRFSDLSAGIQTRSIIRFLHTGEALGWIGQTIAGLASLAALFLVWTGLALSYRRLIQPLFIAKSS